MSNFYIQEKITEANVPTPLRDRGAAAIYYALLANQNADLIDAMLGKNNEGNIHAVGMALAMYAHYKNTELNIYDTFPILCDCDTINDIWKGYEEIEANSDLYSLLTANTYRSDKLFKPMLDYNFGLHTTEAYERIIALSARLSEPANLSASDYLYSTYVAQKITESGTYDLGTDGIIVAIAGGGGGGYSYKGDNDGAYQTAGGNAGQVIQKAFSLIDSTSVEIAIGAGGAGGTSGRNAFGRPAGQYVGSNGEETKVGDIVTCAGGLGGSLANKNLRPTNSDSLIRKTPNTNGNIEGLSDYSKNYESGSWGAEGGIDPTAGIKAIGATGCLSSWANPLGYGAGATGGYHHNDPYSIPVGGGGAPGVVFILKAV